VRARTEHGVGPLEDGARALGGAVDVDRLVHEAVAALHLQQLLERHRVLGRVRTRQRLLTATRTPFRRCRYVLAWPAGYPPTSTMVPRGQMYWGGVWGLPKPEKLSPLKYQGLAGLEMRLRVRSYTSRSYLPGTAHAG
jgi:hypothetical protein